MGIVFIIKERNLAPKLVRQSNMFNRREKIIKKDGSKPSELEEEVAKRLHQIEQDNADLKKELSIILITSAELVDYEDADKGVLSTFSLEFSIDPSELSRRQVTKFWRNWRHNTKSQS